MKRVSRVVKSDDEIRIEMKAAGKSAVEIGAALDERKARADEAQRLYDRHPPAPHYKRTQH